MSSHDLDTVQLLSRITGKEFQQRHLTPRITFLAALATVLIGVTYADNQATDGEKLRLQKILNQFIPARSGISQLVKLMIQGVRQHRTYAKSSEITKLTRYLSESEKLLLIAFGYEIAIADGSVDSVEQRYVQAIAKCMEVQPRHLAVIEAGLTKQEAVDPDALSEVQNLLDPTRFQAIDPIFANAASYILSSLPTKSNHRKSQQTSSLSYKELEKFQKQRQQLLDVVSQLSQIIHSCEEHNVLPQNIESELAKLLQKLESQRFRLAIVGEFSQGKSTLLNALLGEEIQPVRAIPCSGTVTVLKYGSQQRVTCRYTDGREEEIPFSQYQEKASISEEAALCSLADELAKSEIEEIVLEHPGLEFCRHNVEIIDSPGLNEHPNRTVVTQKLLKDVDAAVFLANASRPLTQGERGLVQDLKSQLKGNRDNEPVENLFVLVNFMDLLRRDRDRQQVRQLVENFLQGQNPIITGENRIHFISAQAALDAILEGTEDEYLIAFQGFTAAIEKFLTQERGRLEIEQAVEALDRLIQESKDALHQAEQVLDGKINLSESEQQKVLELIGEASGRSTRIELLADQVFESAVEQVAQAWETWVEGVEERIATKSTEWTSQHEEKEKILRDYTDQFVRDLSAGLDDWIVTSVQDSILKPGIHRLDASIVQELEAIQSQLKTIDSTTGSHLSSQYDLALASLGVDINFQASADSDFSDGEGRWWGSVSFGGGGLAAGALIAAIGVGFLPALLVGGAIGALVGWLWGEDPEVIRQKMKQEVYDKGFEKLAESAETIVERICGNVAASLYQRSEIATEAIKSSLSILNALLEQQAISHQASLQKREDEKAWIEQTQQKFSQVQGELPVILG
ncbi:dynamin family protein [Leptolyngbya sp. FACHB-671]|nr:dynamin family protein [Leptolyngbya sp. FACHB-671]